MSTTVILVRWRWLSLFVCLCFLAGKSFSQTGILVTYYDGSEQGYAIETSGKLYFENASLLIQTVAGGGTTTIPVSIIRKIAFSNSVVPVTLSSFSVRNDKALVLLFWQTATETNSSRFIIERSSDGYNYQQVGTVAAADISTGSNYSFTDVTPLSGVSYYRLKQVDISGESIYSKVLSVNRTASTGIVLLPNPASSYISIKSTTFERLNVKIYAASGQLMISGTYAPGEQISLSKLTTGVYIAIINNNPYKLIKQ